MTQERITVTELSELVSLAREYQLDNCVRMPDGSKKYLDAELLMANLLNKPDSVAYLDAKHYIRATCALAVLAERPRDLSQKDVRKLYDVMVENDGFRETMDQIIHGDKTSEADNARREMAEAVPYSDTHELDWNRFRDLIGKLRATEFAEAKTMLAAIAPAQQSDEIDWGWARG